MSYSRYGSQISTLLTFLACGLGMSCQQRHDVRDAEPSTLESVNASQSDEAKVLSSPDQEAIMTAVERAVLLPPGARAVTEYARYYAYSDQHRVTAVYILPPPDLGPALRCMRRRDDKSPCTIEDRALREGYMIGRAGLKSSGRRWVKISELPTQQDGGCSYVTIRVEFGATDSAWKVISAGCNGE